MFNLYRIYSLCIAYAPFLNFQTRQSLTSSIIYSNKTPITLSSPPSHQHFPLYFSTTALTPVSQVVTSTLPSINSRKTNSNIDVQSLPITYPLYPVSAPCSNQTDLEGLIPKISLVDQQRKKEISSCPLQYQYSRTEHRMSQTCNLPHGLPHQLFWPHKTQLCLFMKRLSQQRSNLESLGKSMIAGKTIKEPVGASIFDTNHKLFNSKSTVRHSDIIKLGDLAIKKMRMRQCPKKNWNIEETSVLRWIVYQFEQIFGVQFHQMNLDDWESVCSYVPGKNRNQCLFKMLKTIKANLSEHPWTLQQDTILKELIESFPDKDWNSISEELYFKSSTPNIYRTPKQCKEHWSSYLVHELKKGPWEVEEDIALIRQVMRVGKKWIQVGKELLGRTENAIKNRYNLLVSKYESTFTKDSSQNLEVILDKIKQENQHEKQLNLPRRKTQKGPILEDSDEKSQLESNIQLRIQQEGEEQIQPDLPKRMQEQAPVKGAQTGTNIEVVAGKGQPLRIQAVDRYESQDIGRFLFIDGLELDYYPSSQLGFAQNI